MNKDSNKTKEQLMAELAELRKKSKEQLEKLSAVNQQLLAGNQQLQATEQQLRAANQQLMASEAIFKHLSLIKKAILESPVGIVVFALDKNYCYLDFTLPHKQTMKTIWGVDIEIGNNMLDYIKFKPDREKAKKNFDRALKGEQFVLYEEYGNENLKRTFFENRYSPVYDENNNIIGLSVYVIDITERKRAENKLLESETKFRRLAEKTSVAIMIYQNDHYIYANPASEKITGYSFAELKQMEIWSMVSPEYVNLVKERGQARQRGEYAPSGYEFKIITKQGKEKWVFLNGNTLEMNNGKAGLITATDITERKQAEEALKAANQQLEANNQQLQATEQQLRAANQQLQANEEALKASEERLDLAMMIKNEGIWDWNMATDQIDFDERYYTMAGYDPGDFANNFEEFQKRVHPEDMDYVMSTTEQYLDGQIEQFQVEFRFKRKNGSWMWILGRGQIVERDEKGTPLRFIGTHSDITERKQAEEELIKLYTAVNQSSSAIVITDTDGKIEFVNPKFTEITGYSREEVIGDNPRLLKPGEHPSEMYKALWETVSSGKTWRGIFQTTKKNGELYWESASVSPIFNEQGKIINYVKVAEDITELKQAEDNFRHSIDESPLGIRIVNRAGKTIYVNQALLDIYEFSSLDEFNSTKAIDRYTEKSYREHLERKRIRQEGGDISNYEISIRRKDGEIKHIKVWRKEVIWNREKHFQVINQDITELKRLNTDLILAKEKAEESEYKVRSMFENTQIGILYCNAEGKILEVNKVMLDILGSPSKEATLKINVLTFRPLQEIGITQNIEKCISEKMIVTGNTVYSSKWGKTIFIKYYLVPVIVNNKVIGVWANVNNLTDLWNTQNQLKKAKEKAEESDRLKSAFLANMSHEIRTPMNSILGFTGLLKEPQLSGEEKDEFIRIIEKSGNRLLNTINDIIDISKIEAGEVKVSKSQVLVNEILEEQYHIFYQEAKSKGLELNYKPGLPDGESRMITDKHKLEGILTNLIKNAIKFTETGSITFGYDMKTLEGKKYFEFYVKDTGIGIPADRIAAVFNRFEQADIEDRKVFEGSGLGLAIAKSYVEMLGGKISVKSKEGEGSTFTFSLPYNRQSLKESEATQNNENEEESGIFFKNLSIIVAEDDETSILFYKTIFKNKFKKITFTSTGEETIEEFRENPETDIILMDIKMPGMNGYDATREIRKFNTNVVIIAQTAFGLAGDREKALEAGCDDYISKPVKKEIFFEKIRACLERKSH